MFEKCLKFSYIYISKYLKFFNRWIFVGEVLYFYVKETKKEKEKKRNGFSYYEAVDSLYGILLCNEGKI